METSGRKLVDVLTEVVEGSTTSIKVFKDMVGDEKIARIEVSERPVEPIRKESPARDHVFYDAAGFIAFVEKNSTKDTIVLADVGENRAVAILDDHAKTGFESVHLEPQYHPLMKKVLKTILSCRGNMMEIKEFAIEVMRCRDVIVADENNNALDIAMLMQQITISSRVTSSHGTGKKSVNGLMCITEVKGQTDPEGEPINLPDGITVEVPIFVNTEPVKFTIDLTIKAGQNAAGISADSPDLDVQTFNVFEKMLEPIKEMDDVLFSLGSPDTAPWDYVK
jgi:hypothetical protein